MQSGKASTHNAKVERSDKSCVLKLNLKEPWETTVRNDLC